MFFWGLTVVSWALNVVPCPRLKDSDVWALYLCWVFKGYLRVTLLRARTKGPCGYPENWVLGLELRV